MGEGALQWAEQVVVPGARGMAIGAVVGEGE
jgi:hypothetical protein